MCGITGVISSGIVDSINAYCEAHVSIRHRGPDDEGFVVKTAQGKIIHYGGNNTHASLKTLPHIRTCSNISLVLGHHRLSVQDVSEGGHQPMYFDGIWLAYNGEVYNYKELRDELRAVGYEFETSSDTEVVLKAWHFWKERAFNRFNGMWALALFQEKSDQIILSRDRFGIKPLYYAKVDKTLYFASEVKFFKSLVKLKLNECRTAEYLAHCRMDHHEETMLDPVRQLAPAHWAAFSIPNQELKTIRYWELPKSNGELTDIDQATVEFGGLFDSSIALRMRSDMPVGSLLSGGLDSTAIVCNLDSRGLLPNEGFHTYSAVFDDPQYSEKKEIDETIKKCPLIKANFVTYKPEDVIANLTELIDVQDFPFRSLAVYSQYELYKQINKEGKVTVLLNGQGADEIFGGYTAHLYSSVAGLLGAIKLLNAWKEAKAVSHTQRVATIEVLRIAMSQLAVHLKAVFWNENLREDSRFSGLKICRKPIFDPDVFQNSLKVNLQHTSLPEYLRYEDRNSMAFSKEARLPFLDYRLVEWAFSLAPELKIYRGVSKRIERIGVANYATAAIVKATKKKGFISPQERWQRAELKDWVEERQVIKPFTFVNEAIFSKHRGSQSEVFKWRLACLNEWYSHIK